MKSGWRLLKAKLGIVLPILHRPVDASLGCILAADCEFGRGVKVQRWTRMYGCKFSDWITIGPRSYYSDVQVGSCSAFNSGISMDRVRIGKFCSIGPRCFAGFGEHPTHMLSTSPIFYSSRNQCGLSFADRDYFEETKLITIGSDVWIGADVYIRNGVKIGNGAILAAGAKIMHDVEDYAIVGGVPAKLIRYRFEAADREVLARLQWWNWDMEVLRDAAPIIRAANIVDLEAFAKERKLG